MTEMERNHWKRAGGICAMAFLTAGIVALSALYSGATYTPGNIRNTTLPPSAALKTAEIVQEPADATHVLKLHFLGSIVAGSMLGSDTYGTFNAMASSQEPAYFLAGASSILQKDDWSFALCDATFSDREYLETAERTEREWFLGRADAAKIFASSGVDVVSVATRHTGDYGDIGCADTIAALEAAGVQWGDNAHAAYLEKDGIRIGVYLCRMETTADSDWIAEWAEKASERCDLSVIYFTSALDAAENRQAAERWISAGCAYVIGSETVAMGTRETLGEGVYISSLGRFLAGEERVSAYDRVLFRLSVSYEDGEILHIAEDAVPFADGTNLWQPEPLAEKAASSVVQRFFGTETE